MYPTLIEIGNFTITTFGVMMFLAFLSAAWATAPQYERRGLSRELAWDLLAWVAIGGIVGAKVYYLALHWQDLAANPLRELTSRGGLVWYGGLIGGVLAYYWQIRRRNLPVGDMFDSVAPGLMLAYAVGRIGCFLVGDDYGLPTDSWVGIAFPQGAPPSTAGYLRSVGADIPASIPDATIMSVHPTQLYEVAAGLTLFAFLWWMSKRGLRSGQLFGLYLGLYGVERFLIEIVRAKGDRLLLGLSTSQMLSVLLLGLAVFIWQRAGATARPAAAAVARAAGPAPNRRANRSSR
ncbi:MAG TPA: prolipoprotein diacylglyceryl transferase [Longimicrobiales bacterium]|nr:prolipoprotein diacylglyceryl transferase [Longimicrobiales bacterium]